MNIGDMQAWRVTSEDGSESRIVTGSGPMFPYKEIAMCLVARKFGRYRVKSVSLDELEESPRSDLEKLLDNIEEA